MRSPTEFARAVVLTAALTALAAPVSAHVRSESFSRWTYSTDLLTAVFTVAEREAVRIPGTTGTTGPVTGRALAEAVAEYLRPRLDPGPGCVTAGALRPLAARPGYVRVEARWRCRAAPDALRIGAFFDIAAEHTHFVNWRAPDGAADSAADGLVVADDPVWPVPPESEAAPHRSAGTTMTFLEVLRLGMTHILGGPDHVVFLLALMIACAGVRQLVWAVTGFTVGHSITLALTALGSVVPAVGAVEATIGLTIALPMLHPALRGLPEKRIVPSAGIAVALMFLPFVLTEGGRLGLLTLLGLGLFALSFTAMPDRVRRRAPFWMGISGLFGLVHGFGFAGAFADSGSGLAVRPLTLFAFNLGVEAGQLLILAVLLALVAGMGRLIPVSGRGIAADGLSAAIFGMGLFWFYLRGL